ncbi:hypothetical protein [Chryseobacterium lathyri]|uniref:hypothetical protein n=1 Tax=Chryseobacterium lathyri TaxID=395933 RepID=UPI001CC14946|nr:hypothetical protein [Chryseobacterium lathyri]
MHKTLYGKLTMLCLLTFLPVSVFSQTNYYVKSGGTGSGTSWDNPLGAIPVLGQILNNVHIYVAEGDYNLGTTTYSYTGNDVLFQGGFPADATGTDLTGYNPEMYISRVIKPANDGLFAIGTTSATFNVNKLTIKGIYYTNTGAGSAGNFFSAGVNGNYQLKIEDCTIYDATATAGFIRTDTFTSTTTPVTQWIHNNKFYRNTMGSTGVIAYSVVNGNIKVLFSNNLIGEGNSTDGTGFYATTAGNTATSQARFYIIGNIFSCGTANSTTGGVYFTTAGNLVAKNNVFLGVRGTNYGGAIFLTASRGFQIDSNYFIQNYTSNTTVGAGGAIAIEGAIDVGSMITTNYIKNNFFFENKVNTSTNGGSAISLAAATASTTATGAVDITGNIFAYNSALAGTGTNRQATIQTRGNNIGNISNNVFYGNRNSGGDQDIYAEIRATNASNITGVIDNNKFQLPNAVAYTGNNLQLKIVAGTGNTFGTTKADIADVNAGDFTIDCYTGSVGCFKIDDSDAATAKISKIGISTFKSQSKSWPQKDMDGNDINNGIMVLDSNTKPLVVTRVKNPAKTLGTDASLKGAVAYDTERKCLMLFDGDKWDCLAKGCDKSIYDVLESIKAQLGTP